MNAGVGAVRAGSSSRRERIATVLLALLALPVVADVGFGHFSTFAAALEHVAVQIVLWPFVFADRLALLPHRPRDVVVQGLILGAAACALSLLWDRGRRAAGLLLELGFGLPLLLVALAVVGAGFGLAPALFSGALAATMLGGVAGLSVDVVPPAPRSGLPRRAPLRVSLLGLGAVAVTSAGTVLASGPGDGQLPFAAAAALDGLLRPEWIPWIVGVLGAGGVLAAWPRHDGPQPARSPVGRIVLACLLGALVTTAFVARSAPLGDGLRQGLCAAPLGALAALCGAGRGAAGAIPIPILALRPLRLLGRATPLLVAAVLALVHTLATGFLGCESALAHPAVTVLSRAPGTFALQPVPESRGGPPGGAVVLALRDAQVLQWLALDGGAAVTHTTAGLPLRGWEGVERGRRHAFPEELGLDPRGRVHAWLEVPDPGAQRVRLLLDGRTGALLETAELPDACFVSSWAWDALRDRALVGCEWQGDAMLDGATGISRVSVAGAGELEELGKVPGQDAWLAVSLWSSPYLVRFDGASLTVTDRRFVGSFLWGMAVDAAAGGAYLPRFVAGQLLTVDAQTLEVRRSQRLGWGLRPVVVVPGGPVVTASTYDGWLYAAPRAGGAVQRLRLGGWVRDLDLLDDSTLLAGGACGVVRVDLRRWLGE